jgi:LPS export ABC transporter protein LptC
MKRCILAAAALSMLVTACNPKVGTSSGSPAPSPSPTSTGIALKITGHGTATRPVRIVQTNAKGNQQEYELLAQSFQSLGAQGSARVSFKDAHVTFHGKDGSTLTAESPTAVLDQAANTIQMSGGVHAQSASGTTLTCDQLLYDHATQMVFGTGHVQIAGKQGFRAAGSKFRSDVSLTHVRMQ